MHVITSEPNHQHSSLRERQKQARIDSIILAAKELFSQKGYTDATIEMIADKALVSTPTIYNYFKTKDRLLLALIQSCDEEIITALNRSTEHPNSSAEVEVANLLILIVSESLNALDPVTWRYAYSNKVLESNTKIGSGYIELNSKLYNTLENLLKNLLSHGKLPEDTDVSHLRYLFQRLNHALFGEIISDQDISLNQYRKTIRSYVHIIISGINYDGKNE